MISGNHASYGGGLIVKDNNSAARREFKGLKWYPVDPTWRVKAKFVKWDKPHPLTFDTAVGVKERMETGVLAGYPVRDVRVTLTDGSYHEVDSNEMAFKIAGSMAFQDGCRKADPVLLEPIMKVEVLVPQEYMGDVIGNLNARRGKIQGIKVRAGSQAIEATVPLSEMFGYATDLRSRTQGRATYSMEFDRYEPVPKQIAEEIIAKNRGE